MKKRFENKQEFTKHILTLPKEDRKITLRCLSGRKFIYPYSNRVEPIIDKVTKQPLGILEPTTENKKKYGNEYWPAATKIQEGRIIEGVDIVLKDGIVFDLAKEIDLKNWLWVQYHTDIVMFSTDLKTTKANFYIEVPEYEAITKISDMKVKHKAKERLQTVREGGYRELYDVLGGVGSSTMSEAEAELKLWNDIDNSDNYAEKVLKTIEDPDYEYRVMVRNAVKFNVMSLSEGVYKYGEAFIGAKPERVIQFLKSKTGEDKKLAAAIIEETKLKAGLK